MSAFSIVMPNYNNSHYLWTAIESLKHQHYPFKLTIMDGGSTDGFHDAISPYSEMIAHIETGPDKGQADAIRRGFDILPGDILGWINSDDYYFPNVFQTVASVFENHPDVDVVYGNAIHVSPDGYFNSYFPYTQKFNARDLTRNCYICQPACFFRRSAYEAIGKIDENLHYTMDWDLWCRFADSGARFLQIPDILAAVRYYPETKTLSGGKKRYREILKIERCYSRRLFPISLIGFYYYDLSWKVHKSNFETLLFLLLKGIRSGKGALAKLNKSKPQDRTAPLFGFDRRKGDIPGPCQIHMPWYENQFPGKLHMRVRPDRMAFEIQINKDRQFIETNNGKFTLDIHAPIMNYISITMTPHNKRRWKLLEFKGE